MRRSTSMATRRSRFRRRGKSRRRTKRRVLEPFLVTRELCPESANRPNKRLKNHVSPVRFWPSAQNQTRHNFDYPPALAPVAGSVNQTSSLDHSGGGLKSGASGATDRREERGADMTRGGPVDELIAKAPDWRGAM